MWAYKSRMASWRKQNINQMMKAEYKLGKKRQRGPEERPQCQGRVCAGQQRMSGTMKISHIVEELESLAKQFRHYYTLGNREPWRLLSERVTNDMPNNWSTEWIERREINNTDTQFWGVSWVWRGEESENSLRGRSGRCYPSYRWGALTFALSSTSFMRLL